MMRQGLSEGGATLAELALALGLFVVILLGVLAAWTKAQEGYFVGSKVAEVQQNVRAAIELMTRELRAAGRDVTVCAFDYAGPVVFDCSGAKVTDCTGGTAATFPTSNGQGGVGCQNVFAIPAADATATTIRVRADRNENGTIVGMANSAADPPEEDVRYALAAPGSCPSGIPGACITRDDGSGPVDILAVDIGGLTLTYYPRRGFGPCDPDPAPAPCPPYTSFPLTQEQADNIARINVTVTAFKTTAGQQVSRTMTTDIVLMNRR